jgi:hypothetical protein
LLLQVFCADLKFSATDMVTEVDPKLYIDAEWKKSLIEALATLHFANAQSKKTMEQILESISAVPQVHE